MDKIAIEKIKTLIGEISTDQLKNTDCFIADKVQLFMPMTGPCNYAVKEHSHPSFSFVYTFDNHLIIKIKNRII
ncbi:MAG: AraC family transcriptional regulator, partial [Desulfobacteraceae bacterium]|nr:AraC family transcriptional regulator [Desulfobacteraceae bacterium]